MKLRAFAFCAYSSEPEQKNRLLDPSFSMDFFIFVTSQNTCKKTANKKQRIKTANKNSEQKQRTKTANKNSEQKQ